jgi:long-chain acyl-CoA synthetase
MRLVQDYLEDSARNFPDKVALVCDGRRLTYGEIAARSSTLAAALVELGVVPHDRIALWLPNSVELVIGIFAVLKAGAVFIVVNEGVKYDKLLGLLIDSSAAALIAPAGRSHQTAAASRECDSLRALIFVPDVPDTGLDGPIAARGYEEIQANPSASLPSCAVVDRDLACLIYTSGTTGKPKGIMSAHCNIDFATGSIIKYLENVPEDIIICSLPLSFDYGLYQMLMAFKIGGTLVLERSFAFPGHFLNQIAAEKVTGLPGVPTLFSILLRMNLESFDLRSLRYVTSTGAVFPARQIHDLVSRLPWATFYSMYGVSETKRALYLPPQELGSRPDSVGVAIPGTEVWIVDESGDRLGPDRVGELVIRGPHVMQGYWRDSELTAQRFRRGPLPGESVFYSGDLFRMDSEGFMYFVGRKDEMFKSRGERVAPREIEDVLCALPGVEDAAVIDVADPILGQAVKAFVVSNGAGLTERDIILHCREHLEDYLVPKYVVLVDSLPKSANGKVLKSELS